MTVETRGDPIALAREFDTFAARAQLSIPSDMRGQLLEDFGELRHMLKIIRDHLEPEDQPDDTFLVETVTRLL